MIVQTHSIRFTKQINRPAGGQISADMLVTRSYFVGALNEATMDLRRWVMLLGSTDAHVQLIGFATEQRRSALDPKSVMSVVALLDCTSSSGQRISQSYWTRSKRSFPQRRMATSLIAVEPDPLNCAIALNTVKVLIAMILASLMRDETGSQASVSAGSTQ